MEKSNDKFIHIKVKELKPNTKFVGTYKGSYKDKMYGDTRHMIRTAKANIVVFKEFAQLKNLFQDVKKGDQVEITFVKSERLSGGNMKGVFTYKLTPTVEGDNADSDAFSEEEDSDEMPF